MSSRTHGHLTDDASALVTSSAKIDEVGREIRKYEYRAKINRNKSRPAVGFARAPLTGRTGLAKYSTSDSVSTSSRKRIAQSSGEARSRS